ncbi:MAG TPA: hypothetical protein DEP66_02880, partial [Acidimicrobiaceae bacterium]|nr:hypothetical protein [Acidimicrobiaceae bacterium]
PADSAGPPADPADPADSAAAADSAGPPAAAASRLVELFLDRTPFYAESGGQVADVGTLTAVPAGDPAAACPVVLDVVDCTFAVAGVHRHLCRVPDGLADDDLPAAGSVVRAEIDAPRRAAIRRNHTGTHVLHWALRRVLGEHVKQAGSLVAPDRLRFDYSHHEAPDAALLREVEDVANAEILANGRCRHYETTMTHAREIGAIAFFGDKYGDFVRVLEAGDNSVELCGGTHVAALGDIGHLRIVSESSIGSNLRRIEAITGTRTVERLQEVEATLEEVAQLLNAPGTGVAAALARRLDETKVLRKQIRALERKAAGGAVADLVAAADSGVVVADMGELARDALRDVAVAVRDADGVRAVVLASAPPEGGVALVAAVDPDGPLTAADLLADAAASVQGGFARKGNAPVVVAGGRNPDGIAAALDQARSAAGLATAE